jgi:hypothetical protein
MYCALKKYYDKNFDVVSYSDKCIPESAYNLVKNGMVSMVIILILLFFLMIKKMATFILKVVNMIFYILLIE